MDLHKVARVEILNGWKEIAIYMRRAVRTVQRYELERGLPIHHPAGKPTGSVLATKAELDAWIAATPFRETFRLRPVKRTDATVNESRRQIAEMHRLRSDAHRLRSENRALRQELHLSLATFRFRLQDILPGKTTRPEAMRDLALLAVETLQDPDRALADVLTLAENKEKAN